MSKHYFLKSRVPMESHWARKNRSKIKRIHEKNKKEERAYNKWARENFETLYYGRLEEEEEMYREWFKFHNEYDD